MISKHLKKMQKVPPAKIINITWVGRGDFFHFTKLLRLHIVCVYFLKPFLMIEKPKYPFALLKITQIFGKANITFFHPLNQNKSKMVL